MNGVSPFRRFAPFIAASVNVLNVYYDVQKLDSLMAVFCVKLHLLDGLANRNGRQEGERRFHSAAVARVTEANEAVPCGIAQDRSFRGDENDRESVR